MTRVFLNQCASKYTYQCRRWCSIGTPALPLRSARRACHKHLRGSGLHPAHSHYYNNLYIYQNNKWHGDIQSEKIKVSYFGGRFCDMFCVCGVCCGAAGGVRRGRRYRPGFLRERGLAVGIYTNQTSLTIGIYSTTTIERKFFYLCDEGGTKEISGVLSNHNISIKLYEMSARLSP